MSAADAPIAIAAPQIGPEVEALVLQVLRSGHLAQGPMVARFEELCAEMAGSRHAVAVANGTVSLEAALAVLGVGPGDEVITSPLTFAATVNAIVHAGATVRFADVADDYTLDPDAAAALVNERTRALVPVHLYGLPAAMGPLMALAERHGLEVLEDAAQAHGAEVDGRRAGGFGVGSFSFYATKNVTSGEGGVVTTSSDEVARNLRLLRNQGMVERYRYEIIGRNLRLTDLQAAVAIPQLEALGAINERRRANAAALSAQLPGDRLVLPTVPAGRTHVWHQYTVLVDDGTEREAVVERLRAQGVHAGVYYPTVAYDSESCRDHPLVVADPVPRAVSFAARCLSLPVHHGLDEAAIERVTAAVRTAL